MYIYIYTQNIIYELYMIYRETYINTINFTSPHEFPKLYLITE